MQKSHEAFRSIGEVSRLVGVATHVLRYWETQFPQLAPVKRADGRRYYRPDDVRLAAGLVAVLREDGMTIRGARRLIAADKGTGLRTRGAARLGPDWQPGAEAQTAASPGGATDAGTQPAKAAPGPATTPASGPVSAAASAPAPALPSASAFSADLALASAPAPVAARPPASAPSSTPAAVPAPVPAVLAPSPPAPAALRAEPPLSPDGAEGHSPPSSIPPAVTAPHPAPFMAEIPPSQALDAAPPAPPEPVAGIPVPPAAAVPDAAGDSDWLGRLARTAARLRAFGGPLPDPARDLAAALRTGHPAGR